MAIEDLFAVYIKGELGQREILNTLQDKMREESFKIEKLLDQVNIRSYDYKWSKISKQQKQLIFKILNVNRNTNTFKIEWDYHNERRIIRRTFARSKSLLKELKKIHKRRETPHKYCSIKEDDQDCRLVISKVADEETSAAKLTDDDQRIIVMDTTSDKTDPHPDCQDPQYQGNWANYYPNNTSAWYDWYYKNYAQRASFGPRRSCALED